MKYNGEHDALLVEAYEAGEWRITCPVCRGGPEGRDAGTMALFTTHDGHVAGKCFRASCQVCIATGRAGEPRKKEFEPRPLKLPYMKLHPDNPKFDLYGLRILVQEPTTLVWKLTDLGGEHIGHVTRTPDKQIRTYKDADKPLYYYNNKRQNFTAWSLWVFEDPMSAAMCASPAIALLGTSMPDGLVDDIKHAGPDNVLVALDPGAEDAALAVYHKLVQAGVPATFVPMEADFKDLSPDSRFLLERAYA